MVVLSLTAPPVVGLACAWACTDHSEQAAGHSHGDMDVADAQIAGRHACSHDFPTVELYSPATERLLAAPDGFVAIASFAVRVALSDQHSTVGGWVLAPVAVDRSPSALRS